MIAVAVRLCSSATTVQLVAWFLLASLAAPFAAHCVRGSREDIRRGKLLGLTIIAIVITLMATADAAGPVVVRDQCATCQDSGAPAWVCWFYCL